MLIAQIILISLQAEKIIVFRLCCYAIYFPKKFIFFRKKARQTVTGLSGRLSTRLTHYITTNPKFQYEKQSRLIYFDKAA